MLSRNSWNISGCRRKREKKRRERRKKLMRKFKRLEMNRAKMKGPVDTDLETGFLR